MGKKVNRTASSGDGNKETRKPILTEYSSVRLVRRFRQVGHQKQREQQSDIRVGNRRRGSRSRPPTSFGGLMRREGVPSTKGKKMRRGMRGIFRIVRKGVRSVAGQ